VPAGVAAQCPIAAWSGGQAEGGGVTGGVQWPIAACSGGHASALAVGAGASQCPIAACSGEQATGIAGGDTVRFDRGLVLPDGLGRAFTPTDGLGRAFAFVDGSAIGIDMPGMCPAWSIPCICAASAIASATLMPAPRRAGVR
jgi:hypothetical protein